METTEAPPRMRTFPKLTDAQRAAVLAEGREYARTHRTVEAIEADRVDGIFPPARGFQAQLARLLIAEEKRRGLSVEDTAGLQPELNLTADEIGTFGNMGGNPTVDFMARYAAALGFRLVATLEPLDPPKTPDGPAA